MKDKIVLGEKVKINKKLVNLNPNNFMQGFVIIRNKKTGEIIHQGWNKTLLSGSEFLAMRMFNLDDSTFRTPTYNNALGLMHSVSNGKNSAKIPYVQTLDYKVCLFCMGVSGAPVGSTAIIYKTSKQRWINPTNLIPFRYCKPSIDLNTTERSIYFGKKEMNGRYAYYFKKFDSESVIRKEYNDGTDWPATVYSDNNSLRARVAVTSTMTISIFDGIDYFRETTGLNDARVNTIELLAAWSNVVDGNTYYQDVRPLTRINFKNRPLGDLQSSLEIVYTLYF